MEVIRCNQCHKLTIVYHNPYLTNSSICPGCGWYYPTYEFPKGALMIWEEEQNYEK